MVMTTQNLALLRCPHCFTAHPTLNRVHLLIATPGRVELGKQAQPLQWHVYTCTSCAGLVAAATYANPNYLHQPGYAPAQEAIKLVPAIASVSADVPKKSASYLQQARDTLSSPSASVMTAASAVDAMLKERKYIEGSLYSRIEKAEKDGVLTKDMAQWAHDVRLDANDERHADFDASMVTSEDATRCLEFAEALADLLFVLPARVKRGLRPISPPAAGA